MRRRPLINPPPPGAKPATAITDLKRLDKVRLSGGFGQTLIVTGVNPGRPSNCWSGVLEGGKGKGYIFGPKHTPVKIGEVTEDHPALRAHETRQEERGGGLDRKDRALLADLLKAVEAGDLARAQGFARAFRTLEQAGLG